MSTQATLTTVSVRSKSHSDARIAAALSGQSLTEFASTALDAASAPVLKARGVKPAAEPQEKSRRKAA